MKAILRKKPLYESFDFEEDDNSIENEFNNIHDRIGKYAKLNEIINYQSIINDVLTFATNNIGNPKYFAPYDDICHLYFLLDNERLDINIGSSNFAIDADMKIKIFRMAYTIEIIYNISFKEVIDSGRFDSYNDVMKLFSELKKESNISEVRLYKRGTKQFINLKNPNKEILFRQLIEKEKDIDYNKIFEDLTLIRSIMNEKAPYLSDLQDLSSFNDLGKRLALSFKNLINYLYKNNEIKVAEVIPGKYRLSKQNLGKVLGLKFPILHIDSAGNSIIFSEKAPDDNIGRTTIFLEEYTRTEKKELLNNFYNDVLQELKFPIMISEHQLFYDASWISKFEDFIKKANELKVQYFKK